MRRSNVSDSRLSSQVALNVEGAEQLEPHKSLEPLPLKAAAVLDLDSLEALQGLKGLDSSVAELAGLLR